MTRRREPLYVVGTATLPTGEAAPAVRYRSGRVTVQTPTTGDWMPADPATADTFEETP